MNFQQILIKNQNTFVDAFLYEMGVELRKDGFNVIKVVSKSYSKVKSLERTVVTLSVGKNSILLKGKNNGVDWLVVVDGIATCSIQETSDLKKKLIAKKLISDKDLQENIATFTLIK